MNSPCPDCQYEDRVYTLKLVFTNRPTDKFFPKYIPQIKETCGRCGRYIRFAPQTQDLIDKINIALTKMEVEESEPPWI